MATAANLLVTTGDRLFTQNSIKGMKAANAREISSLMKTEKAIKKGAELTGLDFQHAKKRLQVKLKTLENASSENRKKEQERKDKERQKVAEDLDKERQYSGVPRNVEERMEQRKVQQAAATRMTSQPKAVEAEKPPAPEMTARTVKDILERTFGSRRISAAQAQKQRQQQRSLLIAEHRRRNSLLGGAGGRPNSIIFQNMARKLSSMTSEGTNSPFDNMRKASRQAIQKTVNFKDIALRLHRINSSVADPQDMTEDERKIYDFIQRTVRHEKGRGLPAHRRSPTQPRVSEEQMRRLSMVLASMQRSADRSAPRLETLNPADRRKVLKDYVYRVPQSLPPIYTHERKDLEERVFSLESTGYNPPPTEDDWLELQCCRYIRDRKLPPEDSMLRLTRKLQAMEHIH